MARTGRPKADKPFDHKVTVKFKEEEYQIMVEYAENHNLSISQLIRMGVELQMKQQAINIVSVVPQTIDIYC